MGREVEAGTAAWLDAEKVAISWFLVGDRAFEKMDEVKSSP
jgi:hypothetical protein